MSDLEATGAPQAPVAPDLSGAPKLEETKKKAVKKADKTVVGHLGETDESENKDLMANDDYEKIKAIKTPFMVVATEKGFYDNYRRNPGDVFQIKSGKEFSRVWMEIKK